VITTIKFLTSHHISITHHWEQGRRAIARKLRDATAVTFWFKVRRQHSLQL